MNGYVLPLRQMSKYCNFDQKAEDVIKLQIKMGCSSKKLRKKPKLSGAQWKLEQIQFASGLENSEKNAQQIEEGFADSVAEVDIKGKGRKHPRQGKETSLQEMWGTLLPT